MSGASKPVLVFDMDGVLVDVSDSYRETIRATVRQFTGKDVSRERIQDYKNAGGWNNDWALSQKIIQDFGMEVDYVTVVDEFQKIFFGDDGTPGLILRERWISRNGLLERLAERFTLAIFTGRTRAEAIVTLHRFKHEDTFAKIVADDEVQNPKPAPDGLNLLRSQYPDSRFLYVGDTVDDARSSKGADVPFVGIAGRENPKRTELVSLLNSEGAIAVLESINELESVL